MFFSPWNAFSFLIIYDSSFFKASYSISSGVTSLLLEMPG